MTMRFDKRRHRRILYNDDADQQYTRWNDSYGYHISDAQSFIDARTSVTFDTHVDTYVWCVGAGCDPPDSEMETLIPYLDSRSQATDLIVEACHRRDMEVWASLRMNDIHDSLEGAESLDTAFDPLKAEHPGYLLAPVDNRRLPRELIERYLWTAFNFARPEVRRHRLDYIAQNAAAHDFDGYELDFTRYVWNFPPGEERTHAHLMTELVRDARACLNDIATRRHKPYTMAVHVLDSPEVSLDFGLDVETWASEGLVDALVVGQGYTPYSLRLDQWLAMGRRYGVPIYPSVDILAHVPWWQQRFDRPDVWGDTIRASSAYYWQQEVDGIYLFNLFCLEDKKYGALPQGQLYEPLKEVGDPVRLAGKAKTYTINPLPDLAWHHGHEPAVLPVPLDRVERKLPLKVGADASAANAGFRLRVWVTGSTDSRRVWLRINNQLLPEPARNRNWYQVEVASGLLREGDNVLSIWCDASLTNGEAPPIVHQVFLEVRYDG